MRAGDGLTVFNTKGFAGDEIVPLGETDVQALADEAGTLYPVQHTEKGAFVSLKDLPAKGWRTYQTRTEAVSAPFPFTLSDDRHLETPYYTVELDENGLFARLYDKENRREVFKAGQKGQPDADVRRQAHLLRQLGYRHLLHRKELGRDRPAAVGMGRDRPGVRRSEVGTEGFQQPDPADHSFLCRQPPHRL